MPEIVGRDFDQGCLYDICYRNSDLNNMLLLEERMTWKMSKLGVF
jgi:hypothetical protein